MGKKQHQKDKLYLTSKEWKEERGGYKKKDVPKFFRLPFECCCLSFHPYKDPCCNKDGYIFDLITVVPFIEKFGIDPISGEKTTIKDFFKINLFKNSEERYHCPITRKEFGDSIHVVAIISSGNVYAFDAIKELNYSLGNFKDLLNDTPFIKKDVITLQNPSDIERLNCAKFYHVIHNLKVNYDKDDDTNNLRLVSPETFGALKELKETYKSPETSLSTAQGKLLTPRNAAHFSTGSVAYGFTCTAFTPTTIQTPAILDDDAIRYPRIKKKGYVQMVTNLGSLNLQLHCDLAPKTCENFLRLSQSGYYNDTIFFRLVPGHMIQGGDPHGTGSGGQSIFGKPFKDEIRANLKHDQRGVISMANAGKNLNTSQFFITLNACPSLDQRFSIFGKVVGGLEILDKMEDIPIDDDYHPLVTIKIINCNVFVNPFEEADLELAKETEAKAALNINKKPIKPLLVNLKESTEIGKYLSKNTTGCKKSSKADKVKSVD